MTAAKAKNRTATATAKRTPKGKTTPTAKAGAKPAARPAKVPIALLRTLEAALGQDDVAQQCAALFAELGELAAPRARAAAAAALAHTRKGTPVARAYLAVLSEGSPAAADTIVRHCATMERGRVAMFGAFVAVWSSSTDASALEAASVNFAKGIVEDPALLAASIEAARRLGNATALAERTAMSDRAIRLAPLVAGLSGAAPARVRAGKQLAAASADDRRHVYARVIARPNSFDEAVAIAAAIATADDAKITDIALAAGVVEMRHHGQDELVAAWKARVAAGDDALVMRLLGLFEWTSLWATDNDQLEPYIHALWPVGGHADVFSHIEHAMASPNVIVRAAVCEEWIREDEGQRAFDDAQIDKLVRSAVAIAEAGEDTADLQAANRALFYVSHPGARHALVDAVRHASTKRNDELRRNLYYGLGHIAHADVMPVLIERMFVEREEYWALLETIAERLDAAGHRAVLAELARRSADPDAIRAATMYADVFVDKKQSPRLLVELARAILAWTPAGNDDARRLRYVFEQATVAALAIHAPDDARAFVTRAKALPASPLSDYWVSDRNAKTPSPFAAAAVKKQLVALETGKLDREIAEARASAEAARAAGTPIAIDDARLGTLAGCTVTSRLLDDRERKIAWFFDEVGELHVYDGYAVVPMVLDVAGVSGRTYGWDDPVAGLVDGQTLVDERVTFLDAKATQAREVIRIGSRVLVFDGRERDYLERIGVSLVGLRFASYTAAREGVARFAVSPPAGMTRVDSWYRDGAGAIRREYYALTGGDAELAIVGSTIDGRGGESVPPIERTHADADAAIKALQAWEGKLFAASGRIAKIWLDTSTTRREDTLLAAYIDDRSRNDSESATWHLRGLAEIMAAIDEAGLRPLVPDIVVTLGPPATAAEIAAYQAVVPEPLPEALVELWREVGGGGFTSASTNVRFLSPSELVARRAALRDRLRAWVQGRLKGHALKSTLASIDHLDVIATQDGAPLVLFDTRQTQHRGECFTAADSGSWMSELHWELSTEINVVLAEELQRRVGDIYRLRLGKRAGTGTRRVRVTKGEKEYEAIVDGEQLMTRTLTAKSPGKPRVKQLATAEAAAQAFDDAVAGAKKKGFR